MRILLWATSRRFVSSCCQKFQLADEFGGFKVSKLVLMTTVLRLEVLTEGHSIRQEKILGPCERTRTSPSLPARPIIDNRGPEGREKRQEFMLKDSYD